MNLPDIKVESLYQDNNPCRFKLLEDLVIQLSTGEVIHIKEGYITDFASVPLLCRGIVASVGKHNLAVLIHDWLYDNKYSITNNTDRQLDRLFADKEMVYWLKLSGVSRIKIVIMYCAVRIGGRNWNKR